MCSSRAVSALDKCFIGVPYTLDLENQTLAYVGLQKKGWSLFLPSFNSMWHWFSHPAGTVKRYFRHLWNLSFLPPWCPCHRNIFSQDHDMPLLFQQNRLSARVSSFSRFRCCFDSLSIKGSSFLILAGNKIACLPQNDICHYLKQ